MMVPRSYNYSANTIAKPAGKDGKHIVTISVDERIPDKTKLRNGKSKIAATPPKMFAPSPPSPSKPVVIPTRTRNGNGGGPKKSRQSINGDGKEVTELYPSPSSTPSTTTSLRAMASSPELDLTSISPENGRRKSFSLARLKMQESRLRETPRRTISSSSPQSWGVLLSPPVDSDQESGSFESDTTLGPLSSVRSLSTDSMPSLDTDTDSLSSASTPATPGLSNSGRMISDRRQKSLSTSVGEDCIADHPLLPLKPPAPPKDDTSEEVTNLLPPTPSPLARSKTYFKSNLTASFRKIRSAAQSISAFTAPPTQREDYLARSLLSPESQFTDERRPLPSTKPPDPALRRYLNPVTFSPADFHSHCEESPQVARSTCTTSIQLQTYRRQTHGSEKASSPPVFTSAQQKALDAIDGLPEGSLPRQRELRENSDFLRVIVLEMDMRKKGKLSDKSPGRARLWLPARQAGAAPEESMNMGDREFGQRQRVPVRWVGIPA